MTACRGRSQAKLRQIGFGYFDFAHVVVVEELGLAVIPVDPHARPIAGTYRALIVRAAAPRNTLADLELFGLGWSHCAPLPHYHAHNGEQISLVSSGELARRGH
jgi:hypothetical protein